MGTWGYRFGQDDLTLDIRGQFKDCLKRGLSLKQASDQVLKRHVDDLSDEGLLCVVLLAVAEMQWKYGASDPKLLERAKRAVERIDSLDLGNAGSDPIVKFRKDTLHGLISKIGTQNPKPSPIPKIVKRDARFLPGDCLSIQLKNGQFGAALVLAADNSNVELGTNLIGVLDYMSKTEPPVAIFESRKWLRLTHGKWNGRLDMSWYIPIRFRKEKHRFAVIGNIPLKKSDPKTSTVYSPWSNLGNQVILQNAHRRVT